MKGVLFFLAALFFVLPLRGEEPAVDNELHEACTVRDWKKAIECCQKKLESAPAMLEGPLKVQLAILYYRDQQQEKAFQLFLDTLNEPLADPSPYRISSEEQAAYEEALKIYLGHQGAAPQDPVGQLLKRYTPVIAQHNDYYSLGYLVAAAYANLGLFDEFFNIFYHSYTVIPHHFLAYKAKGILYIKLFEREPKGASREQQRKKILENLAEAIRLYPQDSSLYKLTLLFASEEAKASLVDTYLNKIMNDNMIIPRTDIAFYVQQAAGTDNAALAQKFIDKAREWYPQSRIVDAVQQHLDAKKQGSR